MLGIAGWDTVMSGLEGCSRLSEIDEVSCSGLVSGCLTQLDLTSLGDEPGLALAATRRFLPRSMSTLEALDLRCE